MHPCCEERQCKRPMCFHAAPPHTHATYAMAFSDKFKDVVDGPLLAATSAGTHSRPWSHSSNSLCRHMQRHDCSRAMAMPHTTPHTRHPWTLARGNSDNVRSFALALIRHGERCGDATTRNLTPTAASKWRWLGYDDFARKAWGAPQCAHKCIICQPRAHTR